MKIDLYAKYVDRQTALDMVKKWHYSNTLPRLNKHFVGFFTSGDILVGVITLGWGDETA